MQSEETIYAGLSAQCPTPGKSSSNISSALRQIINVCGFYSSFTAEQQYRSKGQSRRQTGPQKVCAPIPGSVKVSHVMVNVTARMQLRLQILSRVIILDDETTCTIKSEELSLAEAREI